MHKTWKKHLIYFQSPLNKQQSTATGAENLTENHGDSHVELITGGKLIGRSGIQQTSADVASDHQCYTLFNFFNPLLMALHTRTSL